MEEEQRTQRMRQSGWKWGYSRTLPFTVSVFGMGNPIRDLVADIRPLGKLSLLDMHLVAQEINFCSRRVLAAVADRQHEIAAI